jgi:hypothetical protein
MSHLDLPELIVIFVMALLLFWPQSRRLGPRFKGPPSHPIPADDSRLLNRKPGQEKLCSIDGAHLHHYRVLAQRQRRQHQAGISAT